MGFYKQIIYLRQSLPPLHEEDVMTYHALCQLYGTEKCEVVTVLADDDTPAVAAAEAIFSKLGLYVKVIALSCDMGPPNGWVSVYDERCECTNGCSCKPV